MLRIRRDVLPRLSCPSARIVGGDPERASFAIAEAMRGDCAPVPLRGIVLLREATEGTRLERVPSSAAIPDLWNLAFRLPSPEGRARCFSDVAGLAAAVPVWNLYRPLTLESLATVIDRISDVCLAPSGAPEAIGA
jgi:hypothetical protein